MDPTFAYHRLNDRGQHFCEHITLEFTELLRSLEVICPAGREFSLVKTKLEEACMFAKKSVALQPENQASEAVTANG